MNEVVLFKLVAAVVLTCVTLLGVWTPFLCLRRARGNSSFRPHMQLRAMSRPLSLANCFSAGMLLAMSLVHFLPSAMDTAKSDVSPTALCAALMIGVLLPAVIGRSGVTAGGGSHGHSHSLGVSHENHHRNHELFASFIVILMCFHATLEGVLLGLEHSITALVGSAFPLFVHRYFDGVVVGISLAKEISSEQEATYEVELLNVGVNNNNNNNNNNNRSSSSDGGDFAAMFRCYVWQKSVLVWLSIMPVALLLSVMLTSGSKSDEHTSKSLPGSHNKPYYVVDSGDVSSSSSAKYTKGHIWLALTQALGSGFFLFAGLITFAREGMQGKWASVTLLMGVLFTSLLSVIDTD